MKSAVKKEKGKVDLFGERYRARAHQLSPRLRAVVSYINDNREVVLEHTAMEIATATQTSDATVVRAIQALGFAGLRELKQTMERWFGTSVTSAEKMRSTVTALSSDVNSSIDFVLEGHQRVCEVLSRADNRAAVAQAVVLLSAAVGDVGVVKYYIKQHPEKQFKLVPDAKFERQYFGIAVAKGNSELLGKINAGLQKIVADGTYAKIYKTWFDDNVPTLPAQ